MRRELRPAIVSMLVFTVLTGLIYPLAITGLAQVLFPRQAQGSLISREAHAGGSTLIGKPFDDPKYFWGRLSATNPPKHRRPRVRHLGRASRERARVEPEAGWPQVNSADRRRTRAP